MINLIVIFFIVPVHSNTIAPTVFQRERRALFQEARWYAQRGHFSNFYGLLHMTCSWKGLWSLIHVMHHSNSPPLPITPASMRDVCEKKNPPCGRQIWGWVITWLCSQAFPTIYRMKKSAKVPPLCLISRLLEYTLPLFFKYRLQKCVTIEVV